MTTEISVMYGSEKVNKAGLFPNIQTPLTNVNAHVWTHEKQTRKKRGVTLLAALRASNIDHQSPDIDYIYLGRFVLQNVEIYEKKWFAVYSSAIPNGKLKSVV